jgi:hypothetical protein
MGGNERTLRDVASRATRSHAASHWNFSKAWEERAPANKFLDFYLSVLFIPAASSTDPYSLNAPINLRL